MKKKILISTGIILLTALAIYLIIANYQKSGAAANSFKNAFEKADVEAFGEDVKEIFTLYVEGYTRGMIIEHAERYNATITLYSNGLLLVDNSSAIVMPYGFGMEYSCDPLYSQQVQMTPEEYAELRKMIWQVQNIVNHVTFDETGMFGCPDYALRVDDEIYFPDKNAYPEDTLLALIVYLRSRINNNMLYYSKNMDNPRDFYSLINYSLPSK